MYVRRLRVSQSRGDCLLSVQDFELVDALLCGCSEIGGVQICRPCSQFSRRVRNSADVCSYLSCLHFCILAKKELLFPVDDFVNSVNRALPIWVWLSRFCMRNPFEYLHDSFSSAHSVIFCNEEVDKARESRRIGLAAGCSG